jgi:GntR family transcriptional regulator
MMFIVDMQSKIPIFEQLKKQILEFISIGILNADDQLPSVRSLAIELGVNPNTVSKAYQELEKQGYIYTVKGKGCFVSGHQVEEKIKEEKLMEFKKCVLDMKKYQISYQILADIITRIYGEGEL